MQVLHSLQEIELQLAEIRRNREVKAHRATQRQRQVAKSDEELRQSRRRHQQCQVRLDLLQTEVASREASVDGHRQALNKAKTNKEYAAILAAMNTEKADNSKLETEILQLMEEVQNCENEAARIEAQRAKLLEDAERAKHELEAYDDQTRSEREALEAKRVECARDLPHDRFDIFTRIAEHHDGEALVPVTKIHPKRDEYICSGCNMTITLEVINLLKTRNDLQVCKVCGRILYYDDA